MIIIIFMLIGLLWLMYTIDALAIPLFIVFLILRLCNVIAWSWVMVCLPLIIWAIAIFLTMTVSGMLAYFADKD